jgi:hypothetical protein
MRAPLHAPSDPSAFHFVNPLIGFYAIHVFFADLRHFSFSDAAFAAAVIAPALVITMIQTESFLLQRRIACPKDFTMMICRE